MTLATKDSGGKSNGTNSYISRVCRLEVFPNRSEEDRRQRGMRLCNGLRSLVRTIDITY